jgi:competence ComEA-like helix-hairpin-helix protein
MLRSSARATLLVILISVCFCPLLALNLWAPPQNEERLNLNTAPAEELMRLPGIGRIMAERIIEHRRKHGPFKRPQDILIVRGMHAKLYRSIAHLIRI